MRYLRRRARYAVPAVVVVVIGGIAGVPALSAASAPSGLPALSAQQLLADAAQAKVPELSGGLTWTANLGLPDLSGLENELGQNGGGGGSVGGSAAGANTGSGASSVAAGFDPLSLLSGSYQFDVWLDGEQAAHVAFSPSAGEELDVFANAGGAWFWDSTSQTAVHLVRRPAAGGGAEANGAGGPAVALTPQQWATRLLSDVGPTTSVAVGGPVYVAGQAAYPLLVTPKAAPGSTVDHIEVDIGAVGPLLGVPLKVAVYASGQSDPALSLGFTGDLQLGAPSPSDVTFTPPPGAKVITRDVGASTGDVAGTSDGTGTGVGTAGARGLERTGSGWATVWSGTDAGLGSAAAQGELAAASSAVQLQVPGGGSTTARLLGSDLLNVLIMPGGRFYAGFVTPTVLEAAASAAS